MMAASARPRHRGTGIRRGEALSGWVFTAPMLLIFVVFLVIPIVMSLWVSFSDWSGNGSPYSAGVSFVGPKNYAGLFAPSVGGSMVARLFGWSIRNTFWYVIFVVPIQTALALLLAVLVNNQRIKGLGFFRTVFYFPSVTSSVAIIVLWQFLFNPTGAVNRVLGWLSINGPSWFNDPEGIITALLSALGLKSGPPALTGHGVLGVSWWDWLAGPSWAMSAIMLQVIFTTSGTLMLLFLAALQNLSPEVDEAALVDGASAWQRFWRVTVPQLRPTIFTVVTLGLIGSWQVFDQIYTATKGGPGNTTLTPAFLSYQAAFNNGWWGPGAAMGFVLLVIIIVFMLLQRLALTDRSDRATLRMLKKSASLAKAGGNDEQ